MSEHTFCKECRSWFCIHANPRIYAPDWGKLTYKERWSGAKGELVLTDSLAAGRARGQRGQAFAAEQLGASQTDHPGAPYDLTVADGTRVDVKTSRHGMPLMVPKEQRYKLKPNRVDALLLVWDGRELSLVGQVSIPEFLRRHHAGGKPKFPIPTMYMDAIELNPIPQEWYSDRKEQHD